MTTTVVTCIGPVSNREKQPGENVFLPVLQTRKGLQGNASIIQLLTLDSPVISQVMSSQAAGQHTRAVLHTRLVTATRDICLDIWIYGYYIWMVHDIENMSVKFRTCLPTFRQGKSHIQTHISPLNSKYFSFLFGGSWYSKRLA